MTSLHGGRRPWQDLPSELLGLVLQRIPSHAARVRLRAVCRPWRAGARMQPALPPLLPLLLQRDDTILSLPDSAIHRVAVPDNAVCVMSTGSMLFLVHGDGRCSLVDPSSQDTAPQYVDADCFPTRISSRDLKLKVLYNVRKVVVMSDHIITIKRMHNAYNGAWTPPVVPYSFDAVLFKEKLHILLNTHVGNIHLYVMDIIGDQHVGLQCILSTTADMFPSFGHIGHCYLVAAGDRLLMVQQGISNFNSKPMSAQFKVLEASDLTSGRAQWRKVHTLMGHALFLSAGCAESLPAGDRLAGGVREDCIYFLSELDNGGLRQESLYSGIYNIREDTFSPLPSETTVAQDGPGNASWFFPTNT